MIRLFRRRATESTAASPSVRPLAAIADFSGTSIREAMTTPAYAAVLAYFAEQRQAWAGALVLLALVMLLNVGIRLVTGKRQVSAARVD